MERSAWREGRGRGGWWEAGGEGGKKQGASTSVEGEDGDAKGWSDRRRAVKV